MGIPKQKKGKEKTGIEEILEAISEDFPELINNIKPQTHESQKIPSMINTNKFVPRYVMFKLQKIKDKKKILKESTVKCQPMEWEKKII